LLALLAIAVVPLLLVLTPFVPDALRPIRTLADHERARRSGGVSPIAPPYRTMPSGHRAAVRSVFTDPATWRDVCWLLMHGVGWTCGTALVVGLWPGILLTLAIPAIWTAFPPNTFTAMLILVHSWPVALTLPFLQAIGYAALLIFVGPLIRNGLVRASRSLLRATAGSTMSVEIRRLTETRTAALESHGAELRRIERDLHDAVQAHLVNISLRLGLADRALQTDPATARGLVRDARDGIEDVLGELRGIIRGIYPPILSDRGLAGAVRALAAGRDFPVAVRIPDDLQRPPAAVEAAAYFVVAEALTNSSKHSSADHAEVIIEQVGAELLITVRDDGTGAADEAGGTGLSGIRRRVAALDGRFDIDSPAGGGTTIEVELPCGS
jgi:signal transduction histidine kinase